jgi:hypothetical protein
MEPAGPLVEGLHSASVVRRLGPVELHPFDTIESDSNVTAGLRVVD